MNNKVLRKYTMKKVAGGEVFHSSVYARVQSGDRVGVAVVVQNRRFEVGERQFTQEYYNSGIMRATKMSGRGAKTYAPSPKTKGGMSHKDRHFPPSR